ncbi:MAG: hypothetical protein LBR09_01110 [Endomicrobium sp.]|nr:hypothetical protein [Endomicrobium sp.]
MNGFIFCKFLKREPGKIRKEFSELLNLRKTIIFYESLHRIIKTISICANVFGRNVRICLVRERNS